MTDAPQARRPKNQRPKVLAECPSPQGLLVAEAEEGAADVPDVLEAAETEVEVTIRVRAHDRHPVAAVGVPPEPVRLIERCVPLALRQLVTLLFENESCSLCASEYGILSTEEVHAFSRGGRPTDDLLERAYAKLVARLQDAAGIREVRIGDGIAEAVERLLFATLMLHLELREPHRRLVVRRHRDGAKVCEQGELLRRLVDHTCPLFFGAITHGNIPSQITRYSRAFRNLPGQLQEKTCTCIIA